MYPKTMDKYIHSISNEQLNKEKLQRYQDFMTLAFGVGCGILCLESIYGFVFYILGNLVTNSIFYFLCCDGNPNRFFRHPIKQIFFECLLNNLPGFVMMWCFTFALIR